MKNKFFIIIMVALLVLTSCSKKDGSGKLSVATSPDFPPFEYLGDNNSVVGIEIDILSIVADKLSLELEVNQMDFDSVLPGVQSGKFTVGASGITVTEKRKKNVLFTDPYCLAAQAIVVMEDSPIKGKSDLSGKTISVQTGTTAESYAMEMGYTISAFSANSDAEAALTSGKVDAWVIDDLTAAEMVASYNSTADKKLVILDEAMTTEPYAFALSLKNTELRDKINAVIVELLEDGTIESIFKKYGAPYTSPER